MTAPQIIKTPSGDELVILPRADYEALLAAAEEAAEDYADAQLAAERLAEIGTAGMLPPAGSAMRLAQSGYLRTARKSKGMTQAQVADAVGIGQGYLSDMEAGRRGGSAETMRKLAEILGIPAEQFAAG